MDITLIDHKNNRRITYDGVTSIQIMVNDSILIKCRPVFKTLVKADEFDEIVLRKDNLKEN